MRNNETTERMIQAFQNILPYGLLARLNRQDQADQHLPTNTESKHEAQQSPFFSSTTMWLLLASKCIYIFSLFPLLVLFQEKVQGLLFSPERKKRQNKRWIIWRKRCIIQSPVVANQIKAKLVFHPFWALYVTVITCACTCVCHRQNKRARTCGKFDSGPLHLN